MSKSKLFNKNNTPTPFHKKFKSFTNKSGMLDNFFILAYAISFSAIHLAYSYVYKKNIILFYSIISIIILGAYYSFFKDALIITIILSLMWWIILSYAANITGNYVEYIEKQI